MEHLAHELLHSKAINRKKAISEHYISNVV